jgi:hypothetical protein
MTRTIDSTEVCPYCRHPFYLPSDREEHVKAAHWDFGRNSGIFASLDLTDDTLSGTPPPPTRVKEVRAGGAATKP